MLAVAVLVGVVGLVVISLVSLEFARRFVPGPAPSAAPSDTPPPRSVTGWDPDYVATFRDGWEAIEHDGKVYRFPPRSEAGGVDLAVFEYPSGALPSKLDRLVLHEERARRRKCAAERDAQAKAAARFLAEDSGDALTALPNGWKEMRHEGKVYRRAPARVEIHFHPSGEVLSDRDWLPIHREFLRREALAAYRRANKGRSDGSSA